jgi:hypothetical protein
MPIKVAADIVISNGKELQNIASLDTTTSNVMNDDIVARDNKIVIKDASGTVVKELYGAEDRS